MWEMIVVDDMKIKESKMREEEKYEEGVALLPPKLQVPSYSPISERKSGSGGRHQRTLSAVSQRLLPSDHYLGVFETHSSQSIAEVEFNEDGEFTGVTSEGEIARRTEVVCDLSYLPNKKVWSVARSIITMNHPIPNTNGSHSVHVILSQSSWVVHSYIRYSCRMLVLPIYLHHLLLISNYRLKEEHAADSVTES